MRVTRLLATLGLVLAGSRTGWGGTGPSARADRDRTEANITRMICALLEQSQFSHHPLDNDLAANLLDGFLDKLDATRSLFLQSDLASFTSYGATLAMAMRNDGDTSAAHAIFARYLRRLNQRVDFVSRLLRTEKFDFTGHDIYSYDREHAQRPHNLRAAEEIWRQQIRAQYLREPLTRGWSAVWSLA